MKAMCAIAFFAALRVAEIMFHGGQSSKNVIQLNQISFLAWPLLFLLCYSNSILLITEFEQGPISLFKACVVVFSK